MTRSHANVYVTIWSDPDWCSLSRDAQHLFILALSQPHLSLAGVVDYNPRRWARRSASTTVEDIGRAVAELERARFVVVDHDTEELLIRSFVRHDLPISRLSADTIRGFWNAWRRIESPLLQHRALAVLSDDYWARFEPHAPTAAIETRRSPPLEREPEPPLERGLEPPLEREPEPPLEREDFDPFEWEVHDPLEREEPPSTQAGKVAPTAVALTRTPTPCMSPPPPRVRPRARAREAETPDDELPRPSRNRRLRIAEQACDELGDRTHAVAVGEGLVRSPDAHREACRRSSRTDHLAKAQVLSFEHPGWSPSRIADALSDETREVGDQPQPGKLYAVADEMRRQHDAEAPPSNPALCLRGLTSARAALAETDLDGGDAHG